MQNMTPKQVLESIISHKEEGSDEYTYIIMGKSPRTGKSWLYRELLVNGFKAYGISHLVSQYIMYNDNANHYIVDPPAKQVIIILNKPLSDDTYV